MLALDQYLSFEWIIVAAYAGGFAVLSPPLAWGGLVVGWWLNRAHPLGPRLAGALIAAVVGAFLAASWRGLGILNPSLDIGGMLAALGRDLLVPFSYLSLSNPAGGMLFVLYYSPILLALLLYILSRRYEEGFDGWLSRLRERRAERRQARADRRALVPAAEPLAGFDADRSPISPAADVPVVTARPGEPVALPGRLVLDGVDREVVIVIQMPAWSAPPPVVLPRYGRGYIVGTCIAVYYLAATASKLWLPLLAVGLWFFGPSLLVYEQHQLTDMLTAAARAIRIW